MARGRTSGCIASSASGAGSRVDQPSAKRIRSLSERVYRCECCGLVMDRDVNAARNLLLLAAVKNSP